jgi:hypothetical protein
MLLIESTGIAIYSKSHTKHMNTTRTLCGQNSDLLNIKAASTFFFLWLDSP